MMQFGWPSWIVQTKKQQAMCDAVSNRMSLSFRYASFDIHTESLAVLNLIDGSDICLLSRGVLVSS